MPLISCPLCPTRMPQCQPTPQPLCDVVGFVVADSDEIGFMDIFGMCFINLLFYVCAIICNT
jgi:hypothetical protein